MELLFFLALFGALFYALLEGKKCFAGFLVAGIAVPVSAVAVFSYAFANLNFPISEQSMALALALASGLLVVSARLFGLRFSFEGVSFAEAASAGLVVVLFLSAHAFFEPNFPLPSGRNYDSAHFFSSVQYVFENQNLPYYGEFAGDYYISDSESIVSRYPMGAHSNVALLSASLGVAPFFSTFFLMAFFCALLLVAVFWAALRLSGRWQTALLSALAGLAVLPLAWALKVFGHFPELFGVFLVFSFFAVLFDSKKLEAQRVAALAVIESGVVLSYGVLALLPFIALSLKVLLAEGFFESVKKTLAVGLGVFALTFLFLARQGSNADFLKMNVAEFNFLHLGVVGVLAMGFALLGFALELKKRSFFLVFFAAGAANSLLFLLLNFAGVLSGYFVWKSLLPLSVSALPFAAVGVETAARELSKFKWFSVAGAKHAGVLAIAALLLLVYAEHFAVEGFVASRYVEYSGISSVSMDDYAVVGILEKAGAVPGSIAGLEYATESRWVSAISQKQVVLLDGVPAMKDSVVRGDFEFVVLPSVDAESIGRGFFLERGYSELFAGNRTVLFARVAR